MEINQSGKIPSNSDVSMQDNVFSPISKMEENIECPLCHYKIYKSSLLGHVCTFHGFTPYNKILKLMVEKEKNLCKNLNALRALNELFKINQKFIVLPNGQELAKYNEIKDNVSKFFK